MRTSSAKAKGRRCGAEAKALMLKYAPNLQDGDITVTPSGVTGPDLQLSPLAKKTYPFAIENKNQESLNIWAALKQAASHVTDMSEIPLLFFKRNNSKLYVCMEADHFLKAWNEKPSKGEGLGTSIPNRGDQTGV